MPAPIASPASVPERAGSTSEEYQERAADCLELARVAIDPSNKALFLEMAQAWIRLAERLKAKGQ